MRHRSSDAFILGTYPLREKDRIVSFLTRDAGKKRGVARGARGARSAFAGLALMAAFATVASADEEFGLTSRRKPDIDGWSDAQIRAAYPEFYPTSANGRIRPAAIPDIFGHGDQIPREIK